MARDLDGSTGYLSLSSGIITAEPLTMSCWVNPDSITSSTVAMCVSDFDTFSRWQLSVRGAVVGDPIGVAAVTAAGSAGIANTTTNYSAGAWQHVAGVFASSTSRSVYLNGAGKATDTTSISVTGIDTVAIGVVLTGSAAATPFDGKIAEAGLWNVALSDEEIQRLALGLSPLLVRPQSLIAYVPIVGRASPEINRKGSAFTVNGNAPTADHPRVIYPSPAQTGRPPVFNSAWARGSNVLLGVPA